MVKLVFAMKCFPICPTKA